VEVSLIARLRVGTLKGGLRYVQELWLHYTHQGHGEVVVHDGLISSYYKDGGGVDMQELDRIDSPIVLLWQVGPELAWLDHHREVWS
jgi:hypothetical protein